MAFARGRKLETETELYEYAVGALGRRMRSVAELKRLMRARVEIETEIGKTLVELVTRRLKDNGYLNDAKYAAAYSAFRRDNEKYGRRRVVTDLKMRSGANFSSTHAGGVWGKDDFHHLEKVGRGRGSADRVRRRGGMKNERPKTKAHQRGH